MHGFDQLTAITSLDGRHADSTAPLQHFVSEYGLMRYRVLVETRWLQVLGSGILTDVRELGPQDDAHLAAIAANFSLEDARQVKELEQNAGHDAGAVELWLRHRLGRHPNLVDYMPLVRFGCTAEDGDNLAYALMFKDARDEILIPGTSLVADDLAANAQRYADLPMLARPQGQPAAPTTLGKEMAVFANRLRQHTRHLSSVSIQGKWNGAAGNYSSLLTAYPAIDWQGISEEFVTRYLGLEYNPITAQSEPHDWLARYCNEVALGNTIMAGLVRDIGLYISLGYFTVQAAPHRAGSSPTPHTANPLDFGHAESAFGLANAGLVQLAGTLPGPRLHGDSGASTLRRAVAESLGHTHVGIAALQHGMGRLTVNEAVVTAVVEGAWEVLGDAIKTVMHSYGILNAADLVRQQTRGRPFTRQDYLELLAHPRIPEDTRAALRHLTPQAYIGSAADIARTAR